MARIVVATDGSERAEEAAKDALHLLGPGQEWVLLVVLPWAGPPSGGGLGAVLERVDPPRLSDAEWVALRDDAQREAVALAADLGLAGDVRVEPGEPGPTICRVAEEGGADLVVVGSHGRGAAGRLLLGSVSRHVLEHAPCPVLVTRGR